VTGGALGILGVGAVHSGLLVLGDDLPGPLPHPHRHMPGGAFAHHLAFGCPWAQRLNDHPE